jgi:hypothetical protein
MQRQPGQRAGAESNKERVMAGQIKKMIDTIIEQRANGSKVLEGVVKMKLILKGIDPKNFTELSPDDPVILGKLFELKNELK